MSKYTADDIETIRSMIEEGMSDAEIVSSLSEAELESLEADDFESRSFGIQSGDEHLTYGENEHNDRLSMGQNDAGEWIGFC